MRELFQVIYINPIELKRLYEIEHLTSIQIARKFGVTSPTILRKLRENGIPIRNWNEYRNTSINERNLHPTIKQIVIINNKRYGLVICPVCGNQRYIPRLFSKYSHKHFTGLCKKCGNDSNRISVDIELVKHKYLVQKLSIKQIAKGFNVCAGAIRNTLKQHHVPLRARGKADGMGKLCIKCKQYKPLSEFFKWRNGHNAYSSYCKDCHHSHSMDAYNKRIDLPPDELFVLRSINSKIQVERNHQLKIEVLSRYSNLDHPQCANPFNLHDNIITDPDILSLDHINGNGHLERNASGKRIGSFNLYRKLKRNHYPPGYQVLCANCQTKKAIVNKEHPRKYNHDMDLHTAVTS